MDRSSPSGVDQMTSRTEYLVRCMEAKMAPRANVITRKTRTSKVKDNCSIPSRAHGRKKMLLSSRRSQRPLSTCVDHCRPLSTSVDKSRLLSGAERPILALGQPIIDGSPGDHLTLSNSERAPDSQIYPRTSISAVGNTSARRTDVRRDGFVLHSEPHGVIDGR